MCGEKNGVVGGGVGRANVGNDSEVLGILRGSTYPFSAHPRAHHSFLLSGAVSQHMMSLPLPEGAA